MSEQSEYVLMPREATRTMTMAGCDSLPSCEHVFGHAGEMLSNAYRKMVEAGAVTTRAQTALKLNLEAARDAVREEIGSRLCHLTPHGTRICSRQVSSVCLCEETARAALCSQAPVPEGEPRGPSEPLQCLRCGTVDAFGPVSRAPREMWAMLYLHDWDPAKEGQEHRWEPGKNVFPEIHNVYETLREANAVLSRMSDPKKYWVRRVWMPAHDASQLSSTERP